MDRFEYVMVLISIIVGLSIAHVLLGLGGIIDRKASGPPLRLGLAHGTWLAYVFIWTIQFWWWEFRFSELDPTWTLGLYLFLVGYAVALFLLAVILVPGDWDGVSDLNLYFLERRLWFYWAFLGATGIDVVDSLLKGGWSYVIGELGPATWILWGVSVVACIVGMRSRRIRHHEIGGVAIFALQLVQQFLVAPALGF